MINFFYLIASIFILGGLITINGEMVSFGAVYFWLAIITKEIRGIK